MQHLKAKKHKPKFEFRTLDILIRRQSASSNLSAAHPPGRLQDDFAGAVVRGQHRRGHGRHLAAALTADAAFDLNKSITKCS